MFFPLIEQKLNYVFKDKTLLQRAFTLSSFDNAFNNQTLEFFGDAVLGFIVSEKLYGESTAGESEGDLTKKRSSLVCDSSLKTISEKLGLDGFLIKSAGDGNNQKAIPSVYEAVVGAIYLDGGLDEARKFVLSTLDFSFKTNNYKGDLQEFLKYSPEYRTYDIGDVHNPYFRSELIIGDKTFVGEGKSKAQAEMNAARQALEFLKK